MSVALLMRGHAHREQGRLRSWGIDWRRAFDSQYQYLLEPLNRKYGNNVYTHLSTYDGDLGSVKWTYRAVNVVINPNDSTQKRTALSGLNDILVSQRMRVDARCEKFDLVVVCRFDLELKSCILDHPNFNPHKVNFLWREWKEQCWDDHRRVADAIHILPGKFLEGFMKGIEDTPSENCLHLIYRPVAKYVGEENMNILVQDKFIDSNSDVCENDFYTMIRVK